jgi:putative ABC transport system permease protein
LVNYFVYSLKNLKRRGIRSWLTLLGVFIGIVAVISLITLGNGLKDAVNAQFGISSTQVISVQAGGLSYGAPGSTVAEPLTKKDSDAIEGLGVVEFVVPRNLELLKLEYNDKVEFGYVASVIEGLEDEMYEILDFNADKGRLLRSESLGKIVIGGNLESADDNGFDLDLDVGKTMLIQDKKFIVVGVLEKKGSLLIDNVILMYDSDLNDLANYGDDVDIIGVKVKDEDLMDKAKEDIEKLLRKRRDVKVGKEDFEVSTPQATLDQVNSILNGIQIFIILIASISIIVGVIGIVNTMATAVVERKKEIGIMKAIGARNDHIFMMFFVESGLMGLVGGLLGIMFGLGIGFVGNFAINKFLGTSTTPEISIFLVFLTLIGSFIIGAAAGIVPAIHAARENPVEAIRR